MASAGFALYLLFVGSWFLHLPARFPVLGTLRFDLLLVLAVAFCAVVQPRRQTSGPVPRLLTALLVYAIATIPLVEWPGTVLKAGLESFVKGLVFYFFTVTLATTEKRLRILVAWFIVCQVFRAFEPLYLHVTAGYWGSFATMAGNEYLQRLSGSPYDVINPNGLAWVVLTALCFCHYVWPVTRLGALVYLIALPALLYTLILTGSRTGFLGLGLILGIIWWKSRRKVLLAAGTVVAVMLALPLVSGDLADRYLSIVSSDTKNAETTQLRIELMKRDFAVAMRRPLFGHGLGTTVEANSNYGANYLPAHNLYIEILQELGIFGLVIFLSMVVGIWASLRRTHARLKDQELQNSYLVALLHSSQAWLGLTLLFSFFSYGLSAYEWYLLAGLSEVLSRLLVAGQEKTTVATKQEPEPPVLHPAWRLTPAQR